MQTLSPTRQRTIVAGAGGVPVVTPQPIVSSIRARLKRLLIPAHMTSMTHAVLGQLCSLVGCGLHRHLDLSHTIYSTAIQKDFRVRTKINCDTRNVIYVVTCTKCGVQGVGDCYDAKARLFTYIWRLTMPHFTATLPACNDPSDLELALVDRLTSYLATPRCRWHSIRVRREDRWIERLQASLNKRERLAFLYWHLRRSEATLFCTAGIATSFGIGLIENKHGPGIVNAKLS